MRPEPFAETSSSSTSRVRKGIRAAAVVFLLIALEDSSVLAAARASASQPGASSIAATQPANRILYISPHGSDRWSGRLPETNLAGDDGPFATIQRAVRMAVPGDVITLRGGEYDLSRSPDKSIVFVRGGERGRPITLTGHAGERVVLRTLNSRPVFRFGANLPGRARGVGHLVFRKLHIAAGHSGWRFDPPPVRWTPDKPVAQLWANQVHDIVIEDCEVDGRGKIDTAIYCRNAGVRNLTVRRCNFHHTVGTEGTVDIGEWKTDPARATPRSASHDLVFEDCDFHDSQHPQSNGIVTQPCVFNVTLRRCRAWNNGKYGFALKGSGAFRLDRCAAWGNNSSQFYCRGFGTDYGSPRPPALGDFLLTNCIAVAPADQRGGAALNWRENCNLTAYHCTIVGLRRAAHKQPGGFAFVLGEQPAVPSKAVLRNCLVAGFNDSPAVRLHVATDLGYIPNVRYEGDHNLFFATAEIAFRYQDFNMTDLPEWQNWWRQGRPGGDDAAAGPRPGQADTHSVFADPKFAAVDPLQAPLSRKWAATLFDPGNHIDLRPTQASPAHKVGENLASLGIPELLQDYAGTTRPADGPWSAGALQGQ